jgi:TatA/E family protein of Tat protein translocase
MFDIGFQEVLLIMVLALLVFGPSKLPELGKMIGRAMREFKRASDEFRSTVETNLNMNEVEVGRPFDSPAVTPAVGGVASGPTIMPAATATPTQVSEPALASAELSAESGGVATAVALSPEPYWAQRDSRLFHSRECAWAARIPEGERVCFETVAEARERGYMACPVCEPWRVGFAL